MTLTTQQVAAKLGVKAGRIVYLVKVGALKPSNPAQNGKRVHFQFDQKAVMEFKRAIQAGEVKLPRTHVWNKMGSRVTDRLTDRPAGQIRQSLADITTRLTRIEAELKLIVGLWG